MKPRMKLHRLEIQGFILEFQSEFLKNSETIYRSFWLKKRKKIILNMKMLLQIWYVFIVSSPLQCKIGSCTWFSDSEFIWRSNTTIHIICHPLPQLFLTELQNIISKIAELHYKTVLNSNVNFLTSVPQKSLPSAVLYYYCAW